VNHHAIVLASSRRASEDRALVFDAGERTVIVVADGAGGIAGGAHASDAVIAAVKSVIDDQSADLDAPFAWRAVLERVDEELARTRGGESTGVVVCVSPRSLVGAAVGDSGAWIVRDDGIDELTSGRATRRAGTGMAEPILFSRPPLSGTLVVASDGLFAYADRGIIANVVRDRAPDDAAEELRRLVQLPSGAYHDDVAIVVVSQRERIALPARSDSVP
jgi:serine/threonine protein phosphatase PrpC